MLFNSSFDSHGDTSSGSDYNSGMMLYRGLLVGQGTVLTPLWEDSRLFPSTAVTLEIVLLLAVSLGVPGHCQVDRE